MVPYITTALPYSPLPPDILHLLHTFYFITGLYFVGITFYLYLPPPHIIYPYPCGILLFCCCNLVPFYFAVCGVCCDLFVNTFTLPYLPIFVFYWTHTVVPTTHWFILWTWIVIVPPCYLLCSFPIVPYMCVVIPTTCSVLSDCMCIITTTTYNITVLVENLPCCIIIPFPLFGYLFYYYSHC